MKWFHYAYHDYMDERPGDGYQMFDSLEAAKDWAKRLNKHYSGGVTWIIGPATQTEVLSYVERYKGQLNITKETLKKINDPNNYINNGKVL